MIRFFLCAGVLLLLFPPASAQTYTTTLTASPKARQAYEQGRKAAAQNDVAGALRAYEKAVAADSLFIDAWIFKGGAHFKSEHWPAAEWCFERVLALDPAYAPLAQHMCALAEWEQDKFEEAAMHAEAFLASNPEPPELHYEVRRLAENARFAAQAVAHPVPFNPQPLSAVINSRLDEYLPAFTADGQVLIFTRLDLRNIGNTDMIIDDENFYSSTMDADGTWQPVQALYGVNTYQNEGAQAISADGSWLVFTACHRRGDGSQGSCDLYWSQLRTEGWTPPKPFSAAINSSAWDGQPSISADGKQIYFSSERSGGQGGKDLWYTTRLGGGKWSEPENLGPLVNTPGEDQTPFLHPDGQTLYFTSDGHPGMGRNDLYVSRRQADGSWGKPENLGFPINTKAHEGTLTVSLDGRTAYFAANRPDSRGGLDIYAFDLPAAYRPRPVTYARARVEDALTGYPVQARVEFIDLQTGAPYVSANTGSNGTCLVCLPAGRDYALNVSKEGYLFHSEHFNLLETASFEEPFRLNIALQPLPDSAAPVAPAGKPVVLRNVFFASGSAVLLPASRVELDRLVRLLQERADLRIQINGHTDDVGSESDNLLLSTERAKAVYHYLQEQGIDAARLRYKGFGESRPIEPNDGTGGRARNRRTEFELW